MSFKKFGLVVAAALVGLPLAANAAGLNESVSSNGEEAISVDTGRSRVSNSFRGDTLSLSEKVIEDALASTKGGKMTPTEFAVLNALKAVGAPVGTESIIGSDSRKLLNNTKAWPNRAVTLVTFSGGRCTGWMISDDTLATAGHCVHEGKGGSFYPASSYKVYPGNNGAMTPYGSCNATKLYTVKGWSKKGKDDYDYGAIKLDCTVGKQVGWFGFFWTKDSLNRLRTFISGFPGDKPLTMWQSKGKVKVSEKRRVFYKNDTLGGMSGSPVYYKRKGCGYCSMAVHAYGTYGSPPFSKYNHGTRITKAVYKNLAKWKK